MERLTNSGAKPDVTIGEVLNKLAEYEDFEEIFRSKMTDAACDFLKDKEEFARWLDRNKWIAKRCDEYARAEEQGKLLKLPCAVGDTVYTVCSWGIEMGVVGSIEIISDRIFVNNVHGQMIGEANNIFLTEEEANTALKEIENGQ